MMQFGNHKIFNIQNLFIALILINIAVRFNDVLYLKDKVELFFNRDEVYDTKDQKQKLVTNEKTIMLFMPIEINKVSEQDFRQNVNSKLYWINAFSKFISKNTNLDYKSVISLQTDKPEVFEHYYSIVKTYAYRLEPNNLLVDKKHTLQKRYDTNNQIAIVSFDDRNNHSVTFVDNVTELLSSKVLSVIDAKSRLLLETIKSTDLNASLESM